MFMEFISSVKYKRLVTIVVVVIQLQVVSCIYSNIFLPFAQDTGKRDILKLSFASAAYSSPDAIILCVTSV